MQFGSPIVVFAKGLPQNSQSCVQQALWFDYSLNDGYLRAALSEVLALYSPLAGRIVRLKKPPCSSTAPSVDGMPMINARGLSQLEVAAARRAQAFAVSLCNAGVPYCTASAPNWTIAQHFPLAAMGRTGFSSGQTGGLHESAVLPPWYPAIDMARLLAGLEAPMKVQVTRLGSGGTILAVTFSHVLVDGKVPKRQQQRRPS
ncbi:uncharacterized protein HaLaN_02014, partial [Haematococcus lacustris]